MCDRKNIMNDYDTTSAYDIINEQYSMGDYDYTRYIMGDCDCDIPGIPWAIVTP